MVSNTLGHWKSGIVFTSDLYYMYMQMMEILESLHCQNLQDCCQ